MLLVNTPKAEGLLNELPDLYYEERDLQEAIDGNYNLTHSSVRPDNRDVFIAELFDMNKKDLVKKFGLQAAARDYLRLLKQTINSYR